MANPLSDEKELYEKIEKEKLTIPAAIWKLIDHHLGNDVYTISLIAGLHVTGEDKEPIPAEEGQKILNHCQDIRQFLNKLRDVAKPK